MPSWVNYLLQGIGLLAQVFNAVGSLAPPKYQVLVAGIIGGLQAIVAGIAHFYNPDGTSAALPYKAA